MFWLRQRLEIDSQPHGNTPAQHEVATEIRSQANKHTAFFYVKQTSEAYLQMLYRQPTYQISQMLPVPPPPPKPVPRRFTGPLNNATNSLVSRDGTMSESSNEAHSLQKRTSEVTDSWALSQLSVPPGIDLSGSLLTAVS